MLITKTKKRGIVLWTIICLVLQMLMPTQILLADELETIEPISGMQVIFTDIQVKSSQQIMGQTEDSRLHPGENYNIYYYMRIQNADELLDATTTASLQIKLPSQFVLEETTIPINIKVDSSEENIGQCNVHVDGTATIEFNSNTFKYDNIEEVYFYIGSRYDANQAADERRQDIEFVVSNKVIIKSLYFDSKDDLKEPEVLATINKTGELNEKTNEITWTIEITNAGNKNLSKKIIEDVWHTSDMSLVEGSVNLLCDYGGGQSGTSVDVTDSYNTRDDGENTILEYTLPEEVRLPYKLTYKTKIKEELIEGVENEKEIELQNSAKLKESDTEVVLSNTVTAVVRKEIQIGRASCRERVEVLV